MKYTLRTDVFTGELDGVQEIEYTINGQTIRENQQFINGTYRGGWVTVFGVGHTRYTFSSQNWGTMEQTRDAAEMFAADDFFNVKIIKGLTSITKIVVPNNEGAFVL